MKKYTVKNYKGNIVESLSRFTKSHKGMKIVEAKEENDELKIKAEAVSSSTAEDIENGVNEYFWDTVVAGDDYHNEGEQLRAIRALETGDVDPDDEVLTKCLDYLRDEYEVDVDSDEDAIVETVLEQLGKLAKEYLHR